MTDESGSCNRNQLFVLRATLRYQLTASITAGHGMDQYCGEMWILGQRTKLADGQKLRVRGGRGVVVAKGEEWADQASKEGYADGKSQWNASDLKGK